jgi:hypothetical protein
MKQIIFTNWHFMRFVRLALGIIITIQAVVNKDALFIFFGVAFAAMAIFNYSCCGASGCYTPIKKSSISTNDISYEEVVNNK